MSALAAVPANQTVNLNVYTLPDWSGMQHAIGGGPWLVRDGSPYVDLHAEHFSSKSLGFREPRSAVGITGEGKLLLVTVDGRQKNVSVGMTLSELSFLMQKLGAVNAMNLDGGSSTQMSIYGKTVNRPSSGNVGVSNSLIIRKSNGNSVAVQAP
jgi:exopolysaccharide biosynthesis protein